MVNLIDNITDKSVLRHPHLKNKSSNVSVDKPDWIKVRYKNSDGYKYTTKLVKELKLNTVCQEAACPNISECWDQRHATFMIMGDTCTRSCAFCNVKTGIPNPLDLDEPKKIAYAVEKMNLRHVVITSVDRDDLEDGGAKHFAAVIRSIREKSQDTTIEILTPDFLRKDVALRIISDANPDVFNHNLETVPALYLKIRPGARYFHSLSILRDIKIKNPDIYTKSGIMVGLGETREQVLQVMDDLISANVDFLTIGQYLQPTPKHAPVKKYVTPDEFKSYETVAKAKGFKMVSASPFTRSSYHADDDFKKLKENKAKIDILNLPVLNKVNKISYAIGLQMNLPDLVITSVSSDGTEDSGTFHTENLIEYVSKKSKDTIIEHNLETVPALYLKIRPGARYFHSLSILRDIKIKNPDIYTKSGIMVGLGETREQVLQVMDDLISANVDFLTIGQYLQPTPKHAPVKKYVTPDEFKSYETVAKAKGFKMVSASPFTRSSYHADDDFLTLRNSI